MERLFGYFYTLWCKLECSRPNTFWIMNFWKSKKSKKSKSWKSQKVENVHVGASVVPRGYLLFGTQYWIVRYAKHTKLWFLYGMGRRIWVYEDIYISCLNKYGTGVIGDLFRHFPFDNSPCFINTFWTNKARMIGLGSFERSFQELSKRHWIYVNSWTINRVITYQRW